MYKIAIFKKGFTPSRLRHEHEGRYVRYGYIDSDDSDTLVYAKQASEGSFLILDDHSCVHVKHVHATAPNDASFNAIIIAFDKDQERKLRGSKLYSKKEYCFQAKVKFELKHSYFQMLHDAVQQLPKIIIDRLIPTNPHFYYLEDTAKISNNYTDKIEYPRMELDEVQMDALGCILKSTSTLPILIAGPFGTGKTRLLARAAYEIIRAENNHVLICAHHQSSVDTFVEYFGEMETKREVPLNIGMIRICSDYYHSNTRTKYARFFKAKADLSQKDFENNKLFITTLGTVSFFKHIPGETPEKKRHFFSHILIDEAAQTREPETVAPLSLAGYDTKIVIAGDHCQVSGHKLMPHVYLWQSITIHLERTMLNLPPCTLDLAWLWHEHKYTV